MKIFRTDFLTGDFRFQSNAENLYNEEKCKDRKLSQSSNCPQGPEINSKL